MQHGRRDNFANVGMYHLFQVKTVMCMSFRTHDMSKKKQDIHNDLQSVENIIWSVALVTGDVNPILSPFTIFNGVLPLPVVDESERGWSILLFVTDLIFRWVLLPFVPTPLGDDDVNLETNINIAPIPNMNNVPMSDLGIIDDEDW